MAYAGFGLQNPIYYQLMFMQRSDLLFKDRKQEGKPPMNSLNVLRQAVKQASEAGVLKPGAIEDYSIALWALVHGITSLTVMKIPRFADGKSNKTIEITIRMGIEGLQRK